MILRNYLNIICFLYCIVIIYLIVNNLSLFADILTRLRQFCETERQGEGRQTNSCDESPRINQDFYSKRKLT